MEGKLKTLNLVTRSMYDIQKLRVMIGNRIVINFRAMLGQGAGKKTEEMPDISKKILKVVQREHRRLTDAICKMKKKSDINKFLAEQDGVISNRAEYEFVGIYADLVEKEGNHEKIIKDLLKKVPIWETFLKKVKGCGPKMAAIIITYLDPHKARTPSAFWKYTGVDVAKDGKGRSRKAEHLITVPYINKKGEETEKKSITYNPILKTKMVGVLGHGFIMCKSEYLEIYYNEKKRLQNHKIYKEVSDGHRHNMAIRKMIKIFLVDLWVEWRKLEGLEIRQPYYVEKLGMQEHKK